MRVAGLLLVVVLAFVRPMHAVGAVDSFDGKGEVNHDRITVVIVVKSANGSAPVEVSVEDDSNSGQRLITYEAHSATAHTGNMSGLCHISGYEPNDLRSFGYEYQILATAIDGQLIRDYFACVPFPDENLTVAPPPPPLPQPPTIQEAWSSAQIPDPSIHTDPPVRGITGLETRISTSGPQTVSVSANVRGYRITGTATLDHYTISVDGAPAKIADHDAFTFETKGNHTIMIGAAWKGEATLIGPDLVAPIHIGDIGTATITSTRTYPVHEIRSILQP